MKLELKIYAFCKNCRENENLYKLVPIMVNFHEPSGRIELDSKARLTVCDRCGGSNFKAFLFQHKGGANE